MSARRSARRSAQKVRLYHRLQLTAHRVQKAADRALLDAAGITTAQAAVLAAVSDEEPVSQRRVADRLGLHRSAVTGMVSRLLDRDLLLRKPDPEDARAWRLSLSAAGRSAWREAGRAFERINRVFESALDSDEIEELAERLRRVGHAFEAPPQGVHPDRED